MALELAVVLFCLLKLKRIWPGLVLVAPLSVVFVFFGMHQGTVYFSHMFWLWGATLVLLLASSWRLAAREVEKRRATSV